jgi:hypothetical protein
MNNWQMLARRIALALTLTLGLVATGCYGSMEPLGQSGGGDDDAPPPAATPDAGGGGPSAAETTFNTDVKPIMAKCAGCHAGATPVANGFLGANGEAGYYAAIKASNVVSLTTPDSSVLLTHTHLGGGGAEFDATEKSKVQAWLEQEAGL